ncbi:MAG: glycosyltransferase family 39 protein [bacterium]|nr:glycosyltransferase family 39 protein [bacterium]
MSRRSSLILFGILVNAAILRFWGLDFGLPNLQCRPDETGVVVKALAFFGGDLNPHFFRYPTLYFYLIAAVFAVYMGVRMLLGTPPAMLLVEIAVDPSAYVMISRSVSACLGTATVVAVFFLARRVANERTARVAAFLMSVCYLHVRESHFGLTDVSMTFFIVWGAFFILRVLHGGRRSDYVWAGVFTGLSASTKYAGIFLFAALLIAHARVWMTRMAAPVMRSLRAAITDVNIYAAGLFALVAFLALTPFAVLDFTTFWADVAAESAHLNAGHAGLTPGLGWWVHALYTLPGAVGWPVLTGAVFGYLVFLRRDVWTAVVTAGFPILYYLVAGKGQSVFVRYMIPVTPFICVFCAVGIDAFLGRAFAR